MDLLSHDLWGYLIRFFPGSFHGFIVSRASPTLHKLFSEHLFSSWRFSANVGDRLDGVLSMLLQQPNIETRIQKVEILCALPNLEQMESLLVLKNLREFSGCYLTDEQIEKLSGFSNLTSLSLRIAITARWDATPLSHLTNLESLTLTSRSHPGVIFHLHSLQHLKKLKRLDLRTPYSFLVDDDLQFLRPLTQLQYFHFPAFRITDKGLACLSHLDSLVHLNLQRSKIESTSALSLLTNLTELNLDSCNQLIDGAVHLTNLVSLTSLQMGGVLAGKSAGDFLSKLTTLKTLDISENTIEDFEPLLALQQLEDLDLSRSSLKDFSFLRHFTRLSRFVCERTRVDENLEGLDSFKSLSNLTFLNFRMNSIQKEEDALIFFQIPNLKHLLLGGFPFHLTKLTCLEPLAPLEQLEMDRRGVTATANVQLVRHVYPKLQYSAVGTQQNRVRFYSKELIERLRPPK